MKELIEKLELLKHKLINSEDFEFVGQFEIIQQAIQALTSVKSEQTNVIVRDNISEEPSVKFEINANPENGIVFYADSVKGNGLHFDSPSVKSEIAEEKKQHAISFIKYIDIWHSNRKDISYDDLYEQYIKDYNEYLTTLNNK